MNQSTKTCIIFPSYLVLTIASPCASWCSYGSKSTRCRYYVVLTICSWRHSSNDNLTDVHVYICWICNCYSPNTLIEIAACPTSNYSMRRRENQKDFWFL